ncbi:MAG: S8 family serine peptidase [Bacteroidota bacterium]
MRNATVFLLLLLTTIFHSNAQNYYWVEFTDKSDTEFSISSPGDYLSVRAIQRREKQSIPIDSLDLPVNSVYIDSVLTLDVELVHSSKWLNGITVKSIVDSVEIAFPEWTFIKEVQLTKPNRKTKSTINKFIELSVTDQEPIDTSVYGESVHQVGMLNGQYFHNQDFKGQGMHIAVLDGGFLDANINSAFDSLWANNQILGIKDFVNSDVDFYSTHYHGMSVLSCMGGNIPGQLIGTAPKASYWLIRSEDTNSEYIIEEDNWVVAAEFADSVGADIINSSLGYYQFDDASANHTYTDMDGKTTRVTMAANIAASRGMLVFSSAGNEGNKDWKYIIAPSDGDNVIGVGAVDWDGNPAGFTSYGPASDGDVKPNVSAVGLKAIAQKSDGGVGYIAGTSFSSPILAGMAACLWQMNPARTALEVKEAIELSGHIYNTPSSLLGYGIPDMRWAAILLSNQSVPDTGISTKWLVYPNPVNDFLILQNNELQNQNKIYIELFSAEGQLIKNWIKHGSSRIILKDLPDTAPGLFLLRISTENYFETVKLSKNR